MINIFCLQVLPFPYILTITNASIPNIKFRVMGDYCMQDVHKQTHLFCKEAFELEESWPLASLTEEMPFS